MSQINVTITEDTLKKIIFCAIVGILLLSIEFVLGADYQKQNAKIPEPMATTVPTIQPTPTPQLPSYPNILTFTVLSTTMSKGHYQVTTTTGNILYCSNYYEWNGIETRNTYTANIVGTDESAYLIKDPIFISGRYDNYVEPVEYYNNYPRYYYYEGVYYIAYEDGTIDEVSWKQARGEHIIYGKPQHYNFGTARYMDAQVVLIDNQNG